MRLTEEHERAAVDVDLSQLKFGKSIKLLQYNTAAEVFVTVETLRCTGKWSASGKPAPRFDDVHIITY